MSDKQIAQLNPKTISHDDMVTLDRLGWSPNDDWTGFVKRKGYDAT